MKSGQTVAMSPANRLLMIGFGQHGGSIREQLLRLRFLPFEVQNLDEAAGEFERGSPLSGIVLLCTNLPSRGLRPAVERLRSLSRRFFPIAAGPKPNDQAAHVLRSAGVSVGLWSPFEPEDLELALVLASPLGVELEQRGYRRVPGRIDARVVFRQNAAAATIRNLSTTGMFFETDAALERAHDFELSFTLGEHELCLAARVAYVTDPAPGDTGLRGFGARLLELAPATVSLLSDYIRSRTAALDV